MESPVGQKDLFLSKIVIITSEKSVLIQANGIITLDKWLV